MVQLERVLESFIRIGMLAYLFAASLLISETYYCSLEIARNLGVVVGGFIPVYGKIVEQIPMIPLLVTSIGSPCEQNIVKFTTSLSTDTQKSFSHAITIGN